MFYLTVPQFRAFRFYYFGLLPGETYNSVSTSVLSEVVYDNPLTGHFVVCGTMENKKGIGVSVRYFSEGHNHPLALIEKYLRENGASWETSTILILADKAEEEGNEYLAQQLRTFVDVCSWEIPSQVKIGQSSFFGQRVITTIQGYVIEYPAILSHDCFDENYIFSPRWKVTDKHGMDYCCFSYPFYFKSDVTIEEI